MRLDKMLEILDSVYCVVIIQVPYEDMTNKADTPEIIVCGLTLNTAFSSYKENPSYNIKDTNTNISDS